VRVETTAEMRDAVALGLPSADVLLMAAAPADYRPVAASATKTPRQRGAQTLSLEPTDDVLLGTVPRRKPGAVVVGFALETGAAAAKAREKLRRKQLDLVVANDATEPGAGPGVATNRVTLVSEGGEIELPLQGKDTVAEAILDRVAELITARG
jgi:phosphopantothenoylcysteine decarboxylase / phosphopantothenate---cysteine ligase